MLIKQLKIIYKKIRYPNW